VSTARASVEEIPAPGNGTINLDFYLKHTILYVKKSSTCSEYLSRKGSLSSKNESPKPILAKDNEVTQ
jgi:hypothetical protein